MPKSLHSSLEMTAVRFWAAKSLINYSLISSGARQQVHLKVIMSWFGALMMGVHKGNIDQIRMKLFSNFVWTLL